MAECLGGNERARCNGLHREAVTRSARTRRSCSVRRWMIPIGRSGHPSRGVRHGPHPASGRRAAAPSTLGRGASVQARKPGRPPRGSLSSTSRNSPSARALPLRGCFVLAVPARLSGANAETSEMTESGQSQARFPLGGTNAFRRPRTRTRGVGSCVGAQDVPGTHRSGRHARTKDGSSPRRERSRASRRGAESAGRFAGVRRSAGRRLVARRTATIVAPLGQAWNRGPDAATRRHRFGGRGRVCIRPLTRVLIRHSASRGVACCRAVGLAPRSAARIPQRDRRAAVGGVGLRGSQR